MNAKQSKPGPCGPTYADFCRVYDSLSWAGRQKMNLKICLFLIEKRDFPMLASWMYWIFWPAIWRGAIVVVFAVMVAATFFNLAR